MSAARRSRKAHEAHEAHDDGPPRGDRARAGPAALDVLPAALRERLAALLETHELPALADAWSRPRVATLRVNTLRATAEGVARELGAAGLRLLPVASCPHAYVVEGPGAAVAHESLRALQATDAHARGAVYVQGLSSQLVALVLDPRPGEDVLDLCSAPGSKTTQIAALMGAEGSLVANDRSRARVYKLRAVLASQGCDGFVRVTTRAGEAFGRTHPEAFDRVLVDAPCSMEGRIDLRDARTWADWTPAKVRRLARQQEALLRAAIRATRPGGLVVYATCTLGPDEDERVVDRVLRRARGEVALEPIALDDVPGRRPGLVAWGGRAFDPSLAHALRLHPGPAHEGFFVARLRKRA